MAQARKNGGSLAQLEDEPYEGSRSAWLHSFWQDIRFAGRQLKKNKTFTLAAALTAALGIGANTAVVTVVRTVLLSPLPYSQPSRLVQIYSRGLRSGEERPWVSFRDAIDWRVRNRSFTNLGSYAFAILNLVGSERPEALYGARVSHDLFPTLGVQPELGRNFLFQEDRPGEDHVVILSHDLWMKRFAGDPHIVGRHVRFVNVGETGEDYVVVGVMPAHFNFPLNIPSAVSLPSRQMAFWIPFGLNPEGVGRDGRTCMVVARLEPRVNLSEARREMDAIAAQLAREYPDTNVDRGIAVQSLEDYVLGKTRSALLLLLASTGLVLLIACANVANLLMSRAMNRGKEMAVRVALGASRLRIVRQLLTESTLLGLLAGALGYGAAIYATALLLKLAPDDTPRFAQTHLDTSAFLFNFGISGLAGILFGILPAWKASDLQLADVIRQSGMRTTEGPGRNRSRRWLIVGEVALSMVLVTGAGLMVRSVARLLSQDAGFHADRVLASIMVLPPSRYPDMQSKVAFYRKVLDRVTALTGVQSAGAVNGVPLSGNINARPIQMEGRLMAGRGEDRPFAEVLSVSEGYLSTMGVALLRGREVSRHDAVTGFRAALVNETAARQFWPNSNAVGRRLRIDGSDAPGDWREVVGIVKDTSDLALDQPAKPAVYLPMEQGVEPPQFMAVRTADTSAGFAAMLRNVVASVDNDQPILVTTSMSQLVATSIGARRFAMRVLAIFGLLSLFLAGIGLYGVVAYSVVRRTQEIGVRVALGATRLGILGLVLRETMVVTAAGLGLGIVGAFASMRWISSLLYGVTARDPFSMIVACVSVGCMALMATCLPARQALRVDPAAALRHD